MKMVLRTCIFLLLCVPAIAFAQQTQKITFKIDRVSSITQDTKLLYITPVGGANTSIRSVLVCQQWGTQCQNRGWRYTHFKKDSYDGRRKFDQRYLVRGAYFTVEGVAASNVLLYASSINHTKFNVSGVITRVSHLGGGMYSLRVYYGQPSNRPDQQVYALTGSHNPLNGEFKKLKTQLAPDTRLTVGREITVSGGTYPGGSLDQSIYAELISPMADLDVLDK